MFKNWFKKGYSTVIGWTAGYTNYDINYETYVRSVYNNPSISMAYNILENAYCNLEFKVFKKEIKDVDGKEVIKFVPSGNEVVDKTLNFPSNLTTRLEFMEHFLFYMTFGGRVLLQKQGYKTFDLYLYAPNTFEVEYSETRPEVRVLRVGNKDVIGRELEEYHILKNLDPLSNIAGVGAGSSKLKSLAVLSDLINFILKHNISVLKNSGKKNGFFKSTSESRMTQEQKEEITSKLKEATEGYNNAGKTNFLPSNIDFIDTSTIPKDLDWTTGWEMAHKMICGILGIPFSLVWDSSSTYNNSKEDKIKLYKNTIIPIAKRHCEFLTKVFKKELKENEFVWVDLSSVEELRSETLTTIKELEAVSYLTLNEKRSLVGEMTGVELANYKHENADKLLVGMALSVLDELNQVIEPVNEGNEE